MAGFVKHIAGLHVRGVLERSLRLLRTCRALAGVGNRVHRQRRPAVAFMKEGALTAFRLAARHVRAAGLRCVLRRFMPVLDAFVAAESAGLALDAGEKRQFRRAWLAYLAGDDPAEAVGLLLQSVRRRRAAGGGPDKPVPVCASDSAPVGEVAEGLWHSRLIVFIQGALGRSCIPGGRLPDAVMARSIEMSVACVSAMAWLAARARDPPRPCCPMAGPAWRPFASPGPLCWPDESLGFIPCCLPCCLRRGCFSAGVTTGRARPTDRRHSPGRFPVRCG